MPATAPSPGPRIRGRGPVGRADRVYRSIESRYGTAPGHETFAVTTGLIAPPIRLFGTGEQRDRFVRLFLRAEELFCQLFSEPGAGSDLAGLSTQAVRDGDEWVINGQKVWSSWAEFAAWAELIIRIDPDGAKHAGMTVFIVPWTLPGLEIRPVKPMLGGSSLSLLLRRPPPGRPALRPGGRGVEGGADHPGLRRGGTGGRQVGGSWDRLLGLARWLGRAEEPVMRQKLMSVYVNQLVQELNRSRSHASAESGRPPGPEGS